MNERVFTTVAYVVVVLTAVKLLVG